MGSDHLEYDWNLWIFLKNLMDLLDVRTIKNPVARPQGILRNQQSNFSQ